MSQTSNYGYWAHLKADSHTADEPVDTMRSWVVINNLEHLYDEHFQHRINWCASTDSSDEINKTASNAAFFTQVVPWTIKANGMPANIDVAVATKSSVAATQTITIAMIPITAPISNLFEWFGDHSIYTTNDTQTSSTPSWALESQKIFDPDTDGEVARLMQASKHTTAVRDGTDDVVNYSFITLVRLIVEVRHLSESGNHSITGVYLREFV